MNFFSILSVLAAFGSVSAKTFTVMVGANNGLTYDPPSVNATTGDVLAFQFVAKNHSVTQSTFAAPCTASGIDSGFFPVTANATEVPQWSFTLNNDSAPLWFFCAQVGHCGKGMVFAVNPTATKSFEAFQASANATASNSTTTSASSSASGVTSKSGSVVSPSASVVGSAAGTSASGTASGALSKLSFSSATGLLAMAGLMAGVAL